ncbi:pyridoxal-phosphate dependent enzyme, partial [Puniceibacterium confluentis]
MKLIKNPFRAESRDFPLPDGIPYPQDDPGPVLALLRRCPVAQITPLTTLPDLARDSHIAALWVKDERTRMGLGSFKALGAAHVIAHAAAALSPEDPVGALGGHTFVTASAGNHGLSVAAGAAVFGARAVVYLSDTVPDSFALRLRAKGAEVVRSGRNYEDSMQAAAEAADAKGWTLLSDSSWEGYTEIPQRLMQGYLALMAEVGEQLHPAPTHVFVQAGVGGLAAAVAAATRRLWGEAPRVIVVEPDAAPCVAQSLDNERFTPVRGPVSDMGRLDCKEASMIALRGLARDADAVVTLSDAEVNAVLPRLAELGLATTASGGASVAA